MCPRWLIIGPAWAVIAVPAAILMAPDGSAVLLCVAQRICHLCA